MNAPVTVPARTLRMMLAGVLPHAATDDMLPTLEAVKIEVRATFLYLAATDRYSMAVTQCRIPGAAHATTAEADALLGRADAQRLFEVLEGHDGSAALVLDTDKNKLTADITDARPGETVCETWDTIALDQPAWPSPKVPWRAMLYGLLDAKPAALDDGFGVEMRLLARFGAIDQCSFRPYLDEGEDEPEWPEEGSRIRIVRAAGDSKAAPAVLVTRGTWFLGAAMACRMPSPVSATPPAWDDWAKVCAPAEQQ